MAQQNNFLADFPGKSRPRKIWCCIAMCGPGEDKWIFGATCFMTFISGILFMCFAWLTSLPIFITGAVLWVTTGYLLLKASYSEPGILPPYQIRRELLDSMPEYDKVYNYLIDKEDASDTIFHKNITPDVANLGKECSTCRIRRPPLSHHCRSCGHCVSMWDHHCAYVGNCVGQRNHRVFIVWTWTSFALCLYFLATSCVFLVAWAQGDYPESTIGTFAYYDSLLSACVLIILALVMGLFSGQITYYQIEHLYAGQTVKMRHKQGKLHYFDEDTQPTCGSKCHRFHRNVLCWLWTYSARPSLLDVAEIRRLAKSHKIPDGNPIDSLLTLEIDKDIAEQLELEQSNADTSGIKLESLTPTEVGGGGDQRGGGGEGSPSIEEQGGIIQTSGIIR